MNLLPDRSLAGEPLDRVLVLMRSGRNALVSGSEPSGKSRDLLATAWALSDGGEFPGGVFWVSGRVPAQCAVGQIWRALRPGQTPVVAEGLEADAAAGARALTARSGAMLVVIDGLEEAAAAAVWRRILPANAAVLVSSRLGSVALGWDLVAVEHEATHAPPEASASGWLEPLSPLLSVTARVLVPAATDLRRCAQSGAHGPTEAAREGVQDPPVAPGTDAPEERAPLAIVALAGRVTPDPAARAAFLAGAAQVLRDGDLWTVAEVLPHLQAAADAAWEGGADVDADVAVELFLGIARWYRHCGAYAPAAAWLAGAAARVGTCRDPTWPAIVAVEGARQEMLMGAWGRAREILLRCREAATWVHGERSPVRIEIDELLGACCERLGLWTEAIGHVRDLLLCCAQVHGAESIEVAISATTLARLCATVGDTDGCSRADGAAVAIIEQQFGADHPRARIARRVRYENLERCLTAGEV